MLKRLKTRLVDLISENQLLKKDLSNLQQKINTNNETIANLNKQIRDISKTETIITEHAMLRYVERVLNIDLDEIKEAILTDEIKNQIKILGVNGKFSNKNFRVVVKDNKVVTIEI